LGDLVYISIRFQPIFKMVTFTFTSDWSKWKVWLTGGIPMHIPGNGGPECVEFLTTKQRVVETVVWTLILSCLAVTGWRNKHSPTVEVNHARVPSRTGRRVIITTMGLIFGIEIGFKLASNQVIWLLNPCHVMTMIQLYLLAAPNSALSTSVFRTHIYFMNGALLAILFPVTNSFFFPLETEIYWIQHFMILVVPFYLLRHGGQFNLEPLTDWGWALWAYSLQCLYHWLFLQPMGLLIEANLNNMVCPAISDPFRGPHYRTAAMLHQMLLIPLMGKSYVLLADFFITKFPLTKSKSHLCDQIKGD